MFICDRCAVACNGNPALMALLKCCRNRGITLARAARLMGLVPTEGGNT